MNLQWSRLIPASAGSGKTYSLMMMLRHGMLGGPWDADPQSSRSPLPKALRPEAVVAVTFTEAAAQELRRRIRGSLLAANRPEQAQRLEEAYISTIHAFGLRLLRESAFDRGAVLSPRLLSEDEQGQMLRRALGRTEHLRSITRDLKRFGYSYNFASQEGPEDAFRNHVLKVVELLSVMPEGISTVEVRDRAIARVRETYGRLQPHSSQELAQRLSSAAERLLNAFPRSMADEGYATSKTAKDTFRKNHSDLQTAAQSPAELLKDWSLWKRLGELRRGTPRSPVAEGYNECVDAVVQVAELLHSHPGPLLDAENHIEALLAGAMEVQEVYASFKSEAGLLDYSDMVALARNALEDDALRDRLVGAMDCVVIDEFQDTNPLQFALLWRLIQADVPSVMVGDLKQSIMRFQGADARLFEALISTADNHVGLSTPLTRNWRSQPRLMHFINAVSKRLFPEYEELAPQAEDAALPPLHVVTMPDAPNTKTPRWRAARMADVIAAKLSDPANCVIDRHSKEVRALRGSDVAVLCPTHSMLKTYADALSALGIPVRLKADGWLESREVQLALDVLALLHDPSDRHARLHLALSDLGETTLAEGLKTLLQGGLPTSAALERVVNLSADLSRRTVEEVVPLALEAAGLYDIVSGWISAQQARANLLHLEGLAREFANAQPESRMAAGIFGTGLAAFLCWVRQRAERDNTMPAAGAIDENAVELVTWHASKGREWPIVAVCGWAQSVKPRLPDLRLEYGDFSNLDSILNSAEIAWSPSFVSAEASQRFVDDMRGDHQQQILREIYVALTRPREQLLLEWPLNVADPESETRAGVFQKHVGLQVREDAVAIGDGEEFPAVVTVMTRDTIDSEPQAVSSTLPDYGRRGIAKRPLTNAQTPDSRSPSQHHDDGLMQRVPSFEIYRYGEALAIPDHHNPTAVGDFIHRVFELYPGTEQTHEVLLREAELIWPSQAGEVLESISTQAHRFFRFLQAQWRATSWDCEVPVMGLDQHGTVINGIVDCLVDLPDGQLIIDHKSDRDTAPDRLAGRHNAQMGDYQSLFPHARVMVHAVRSGCIIQFEAKER